MQKGQDIMHAIVPAKLASLSKGTATEKGKKTDDVDCNLIYL